MVENKVWPREDVEGAKLRGLYSQEAKNSIRHSIVLNYTTIACLKCLNG